MELKWILIVFFEAAFWAMVAGYFVLRHRYGIENLGRPLAIGIAIDTAALAALAVWDYADTGHVSTYGVVIGVLVIYSLTAGKAELKRIDAWAARRIKPRGGRARPDARPCPDRA